MAKWNASIAVCVFSIFACFSGSADAASRSGQLENVRKVHLIVRYHFDSEWPLTRKVELQERFEKPLLNDIGIALSDMDVELIVKKSATINTPYPKGELGIVLLVNTVPIETTRSVPYSVIYTGWYDIYQQSLPTAERPELAFELNPERLPEDLARLISEYFENGIFIAIEKGNRHQRILEGKIDE